MIDYSKENFYRHLSYLRFKRRVEAQKPQLVCQECRGAGGWTEPILDDGTGPFEQCGWCHGTGLLTPYLRGQWLKCRREEKLRNFQARSGI